MFISGCPDFSPVSHSERKDACQRDVGCLANLVSRHTSPRPGSPIDRAGLTPLIPGTRFLLMTWILKRLAQIG